jgi:hypothetical protein
LTILIGYIGDQFIIGARNSFEKGVEKAAELLAKKKQEDQEEEEMRKKPVRDRIIHFIKTITLKSLSFGLTLVIFFVVFFCLPLPVCNFERINEMVQFGQIVKWDFGSCSYFSFMSRSTVGYGDYFPETSDGKAYMIFYSFVGIIMLGYHLTFFGKPLFEFSDWVVKGMFLGCKYVTKSDRLDKLENFILGPLVKSVYIFGVIVVFVFTSAAVMMRIETWDFMTAFWWAWCTITTIGYGDVFPATPGGKGFTVVYGVFGIGLLTILFGYLGEHFILAPKQRLEEKAATIRLKKKQQGEVILGEVNIN